ncbi:hypothetical protein LRD18_03530 [Halorhodospira halochloris]|uniref:hypothetical protein n=1 Tax=Halorhodospira halochloris TaxID=1052 RepID=UPI001EE92A97|nr:hypothetical protein [Halorhodospira halochloris]MCG5529943.1 hypothetical protein [Halorhodospira halochloris]
MLKRLLATTILAAAAIALTIPNTALARGAGNGFFIPSFAAGSGEIEFDDWEDPEDIDTETFSFGYVLDTTPLGGRVFNYRLNVGLAAQSVDSKDSGDFMDTSGLYLDNTFGFGLVRNDNIRWWLGPLVRGGFYAGSDEVNGEDVNWFHFEFGVGLATGLNIRAGNAIISPSLGLRRSGFVGSADFDDSTDDDYSFYTDEFFVNFAVMF